MFTTIIDCTRMYIHISSLETDFLEEAIDDWLRNSDNPSWLKLIAVISQFDRKAARELRIHMGIPHGNKELA